jgi:hypothetical protein
MTLELAAGLLLLEKAASWFLKRLTLELAARPFRMTKNAGLGYLLVLSASCVVVNCIKK